MRPEELDEDEWRRYVSPEGRADPVVAPLEAEPHLSDVVVALQAGSVPQVGSLVLHGNPADALIEAADDLRPISSSSAHAARVASDEQCSDRSQNN